MKAPSTLLGMQQVINKKIRLGIFMYYEIPMFSFNKENEAKTVGY